MIIHNWPLFVEAMGAAEEPCMRAGQLEAWLYLALTDPASFHLWVAERCRPWWPCPICGGREEHAVGCLCREGRLP